MGGGETFAARTQSHCHVGGQRSGDRYADGGQRLSKLRVPMVFLRDQFPVFGSRGLLRRCPVARARSEVVHQWKAISRYGPLIWKAQPDLHPLAESPELR